MDITAITNLISTIGFPIAISLVLMWYIMKLTENHNTEIKALTSAINSNTVILNRVCEKMDLEIESDINKGVDK